MRRDLREGVTIYVTENIKPNFAEIARQYNVDYRTVKKAYEETQTATRAYSSKLFLLLADFSKIKLEGHVTLFYILYV